MKKSAGVSTFSLKPSPIIVAVTLGPVLSYNRATNLDNSMTVKAKCNQYFFALYGF